MEAETIKSTPDLMSFDERMLQAFQNAIIKNVSKGEFVRSYKNLQNIPEDVMSKLWAAVDWDFVIETVKQALEVRICNAVLGAMETEVKTDVKKLLAVDGVRQKLRMEVYPQLMKVLDGYESR